MGSHPSATGNLLLDTATAQDRADLLDHCERIEWSREMRLSERGKPVSHVHFPLGGIASVVGGEDGFKTELGLIGREGMTGIAPILGADIAVVDTYVQVDGTDSLMIEADVLRGLFARSASLRSLLLRYVHTYVTQLSFALVACAHHRMEGRLARFLLMCHDRIDGDEIPLTHEFMALMIASRRPGVTMTLHILEGAAMIRSTRGLVTIIDREKLMELASDTYGAPEAEYSRLIAPFGR